MKSLIRLFRSVSPWERQQRQMLLAISVNGWFFVARNKEL
jgi:hypothetical protein